MLGASLQSSRYIYHKSAGYPIKGQGLTPAVTKAMFFDPGVEKKHYIGRLTVFVLSLRDEI